MLTTLSSERTATNGAAPEIKLSPLDNDLIARCLSFRAAVIVCGDVTSENVDLWITLLDRDSSASAAKSVTQSENRVQLV
jgi:hypothetical protein